VDASLDDFGPAAAATASPAQDMADALDGDEIPF